MENNSRPTPDVADPTQPQGLRWNHPALDEVCRRLPDFGACLMVFEQASELEQVWAQAANALLPNARAVSLSPLLAVWEAQSPETLGARVRDSAIDLLILKTETTTPEELDRLCAKITALPCALLVLGRTIPENWHKTFEVAVLFSGAKARILRSDTLTAPPDEIPCELLPQRNRVQAAAPVVPAAPAAASEKKREKATVSSIGVSTELRNHLSRSLGFVPKELASAADLTQGALPCTLLLIGNGLENPLSRDAIRTQTQAGAPWIALGAGIQREEDRPRMYLAGARAVLPRETHPEELLAAVKTCLPGFQPDLSSTSDWEEQADRLQARMPRIQLWKLKDAQKASEVYEPLVAHQLKRAGELGSSPGALIVGLPALPQQIAATGWSKLIQGALLGMLADALRLRDVSFMVDRWLVVVSYHMNQMAARAVLRRLQELMPEASLSGSWHRMEFHGKTGGATPPEAAELIRALFTDLAGRKPPGEG